MPREIIVCENCEHIIYSLYDDEEYEECSYCGSTLKTETVYTEEEFQEAIGEYANTKLYQEGYRSGVLAERERCALICENISSDKIQELVAGLKLANKIRARSKNEA